LWNVSETKWEIVGLDPRVDRPIRTLRCEPREVRFVRRRKAEGVGSIQWHHHSELSGEGDDVGLGLAQCAERPGYEGGHTKEVWERIRQPHRAVVVGCRGEKRTPRRFEPRSRRRIGPFVSASPE